MTQVREYLRVTALITDLFAAQYCFYIAFHMEKMLSWQISSRSGTHSGTNSVIAERKRTVKPGVSADKATSHRARGGGGGEQPSTALSALSPQEGSLCLMDPHTGFL